MAKSRKRTSGPAATDALGLLEKLQKDIPSAFREPDEPAELELVSTGSVAVDYIVGGGFPKGKISEVFGVPSSGKSTLMAMACARAQREGLYPVYIDAERGLDRRFAEKMGFDIGASLKGEKGLYITPETFEDTLVAVESVVEAEVSDLILVDSVAALVPEDHYKSAISETQAMGLQARIFAGALPKLTKKIDQPGKRKPALVFVNQVRANIQIGWQPPGAAAAAGPTKAGGGWALAHFSSLRVELKQRSKVAKNVEVPSLTDPSKKDKIPVASLHSAVAWKCKVAAPYRNIDFYIRFDEYLDRWGVDNLQTALDMAIVQGKIERKGTGFLYNGVEGEKTFRSEDALYGYFVSNQVAFDKLREDTGIK